MSRPPILVIRNFFSLKQLEQINSSIQLMKDSNQLIRDEELFKRGYAHEHPYFDELHHTIVNLRANHIFKEALKPSYHFLSCYDVGSGICPMHTDRPQCYRTIDVCLDQKRPWPIYVNNHEVHSLHRGSINEDHPHYQDIRNTSECILLNPGDAVCYSGTDSPHFRDQIDPDNFCHLIFFHFVPESFDGSLK